MKKILLIVLAVALVLSLCTGCNKTRIIYDDDIDDEPIVISIGGVPEEPDDPVVEEPEDPIVEEPEDPVVDEPEDTPTPAPTPTPTPPPPNPGDEDLPNVWPVDYMPGDFPVYPDGEIFRVQVDTEMYGGDSVFIYICIRESSKESYGKYKTTLKNAGWYFSNMGEVRIEGNAGYLDYECWGIDMGRMSGIVEFYNPGGYVEIELVT